MHSDIHVIVRFQEQSVFAGEDLQCTITFKNVANISEPATPALHVRRTSRRESIGHLAAQAARNNAARGSQNGRPSNLDHLDQAARHRATASLSTSPGASDNSRQPQRQGHKPQRSVSIISVTPPPLTGDFADSATGSRAKNQRHGHQRSSTVQVSQASQERISSYHRDPPRPLQLPTRSRRRSPMSTASGSRGSTPDFVFPADTPKFGALDNPNSRAISPSGSAVPARVASEVGQVASERSSGDFYSLSNHSQETIMSDHPSILSEVRPSLNYMMQFSRRPSLKPVQRPQALNLLMGYAQLGATFTLDASLIDQSHFEEVKNKGFLGGQAGGGVVGVKKARPTSGFLGGFNLNNIGTSLNNLIGGDDMSSVKEMQAIKNSRAIPLLSTPQSLLFVDLHLEPGEEKSFSYTYPMPRGLPSSYRGKAIKVSYNITVGVQGLPGTKDLHTVRQVNIPVRVFSGVSYDGEIFGHDLMQPHVILRDNAKIQSISDLEGQDRPSPPVQHGDDAKTGQFLQFVDTLLDRNRRRQSSSGTMEAFLSNQQSADKSRAIQAINRAIMSSNQLQDAESSPNRFEISRNGLRVAVIVIDRPLHRLGETVTAVVDFADGQVPCASLRSTLETSEKVSPSLAVRSATSISRVTRKVYASQSENVLFSARATFALCIPGTATPTFVTTGVNLDWCLRFEFGTIKPMENEEGEMTPETDLLEEIVKDERGSINVAVENLDCETFEVFIPMTVYGDLVPDGREGEEVAGIPI